MNWRNVGILALIVLVLGGYVYLDSTRENEVDPLPTPTEVPADLQPVALFPPTIIDDVERFEIRTSGGITDTVFIRNGVGDWELSIPETAAVMTTTLNAQLTNYLNLNSRRTLSPDANPLEAYGLHDPSVQLITVVNTDAGMVRRTLLVGDLVTGNNAYYVQLLGDPRVYIVNAPSITSILNLADTPPYAPTATPAVEQDDIGEATPSP